MNQIIAEEATTEFRATSDGNDSGQVSYLYDLKIISWIGIPATITATVSTTFLKEI